MRTIAKYFGGGVFVSEDTGIEIVVKGSSFDYDLSQRCLVAIHTVPDNITEETDTENDVRANRTGETRVSVDNEGA